MSSPAAVASAAPLWFSRDTCRLCNSDQVFVAVEMAPMAIATTNFDLSSLPPDSPAFREPVPMPLHLCKDCGHLQILNAGNPELQYRDYVYTTSLSLGLPDHFVKSAAHLVGRLALKPGQRVAEFGSNDGTYLRAFREHGLQVVGIDPARQIAERATASGIRTYADFFGPTLAAQILREQGAADLLVANNVIANIGSLAEIFDAAAQLLSPGGAFVFETQYGLDVTESCLLDTIYHEHLSYFNIAPLSRVLERHGLMLFDVERIETKGGSIRVFVQRLEAGRPVAAAVAACIAEEARLGCETPAYFQQFSNRVAALRDETRAAVKAHSNGGPVAGYGVSVGTSTLIEQLGLTQMIDFLVDDDPRKPDHLTGPTYRIPVIRTAELAQRAPAITVIFAWRYADAIIGRNAEYRKNGGKFLIPLPQISVV